MNAPIPAAFKTQASRFTTGILLPNNRENRLGQKFILRPKGAPTVPIENSIGRKLGRASLRFLVACSRCLQTNTYKGRQRLRRPVVRSGGAVRRPAKRPRRIPFAGG